MHAALEGAEQDGQSINPGLQLHPGSRALVFPWGCHTYGKTEWFGTTDALILQGSPDQQHTDSRMDETMFADLFFPIFTWNISAGVTSSRRTQVWVTHPRREWESGGNSAELSFRYPDQFC